jgi:hypothetical protein
VKRVRRIGPGTGLTAGHRDRPCPTPASRRSPRRGPRRLRPRLPPPARCQRGRPASPPRLDSCQTWEVRRPRHEAPGRSLCRAIAGARGTQRISS